VKFSRERAVRLVGEARSGHPSQWAGVESVFAKIGCTPQTLLTWVRQSERETRQRDGMTTAERQRVKELERENKELPRGGVGTATTTGWPRRSTGCTRRN